MCATKAVPSLFFILSLPITMHVFNGLHCVSRTTFLSPLVDKRNADYLRVLFRQQIEKK